MSKKILSLTAILITGALVLSGCEKKIQLSDAEEYCINNGGIHELKTLSDDSSYGICTFSDGTVCEDTEYLGGLCPEAEKENNNKIEKTGIANPASEYCINQGGESFITQDEEGNEIGVCRLEDGTEVDEREYFRANNKETVSSAKLRVIDNQTLEEIENQSKETCNNMGGVWENGSCILENGETIQF